MTLQSKTTTNSPESQQGTVAVLGYGSQGRAHALNLRDSGFSVTVGLRPGGPTWALATRDGFQPQGFAAATGGADLVALLVPDMVQPDLFETEVAPHLRQGACLLFAHGFNIHYGNLTPPNHCDVVLVAPKGPGRLVRRQYQEGSGVPSLIAVHQNSTGKARELALAYAHGLGSTRAGVLDTTFAEETETDLFGEQAVLCGGVTELIKTGYETLVEAGYQPEVAYFECLHEVKLIVDLIHEGGFAKMLEFVSDTACYGDFTRGPRVIDQDTKSRMKDILHEIQDGRFAREWEREYRDGLGAYQQMRNADLEHPLEEVGARLRSSMSWLQPGRASG